MIVYGELYCKGERNSIKKVLQSVHRKRKNEPLREKAGATVVGVKTYGKGIVQAVLPVGNEGAGFQMTIAEYYTPEGATVHKTGLTPDIEIPLEEGDNGEYDFADTENDPQLKKALEAMIEKMK